MLDFFILIYIASAAALGYSLGGFLRTEPYVTAQEALKYMIIVLLPVFNTICVVVYLWEKADEVVIWRRKNDQA